MTVGLITTLIGLSLTILTFVITQVIQIRKSGVEKGKTLKELEYIKKNGDKTNLELNDIKKGIKEDLKEFKDDITKQMDSAIKNAEIKIKAEVKSEVREEVKIIGEDVAVLKHSVKKAHERIDKINNKLEKK